jgi:hypothetical protein
MKIHGAEGMAPIVVRDQIYRGGKFVVYQFCISFLFITIRRESDIYFIKSDETAFFHGLPFSLIALIGGWWGLPWGPIRTVACLMTNLSGGKDVTQQILADVYPFREMAVC